MPAPLLLIDGYNLMHAAGFAPGPRAAAGELQRGRERLLAWLGERLTHAERARAMVVFDARDPPQNRPPALTMNGVRVIFALPEGDADLILERLLGEQASRHVTVVSSDRRVQSAARSRRAKFEASDTFLTRLDRRRSHARPAGRNPKEHGLSPTEAEAWLTAFGSVSVTQVEEVEFAPSLPPPPPPPATPTPATPSPSATPPRRRDKARHISPVPKEPVNDVQYWYAIFQHLDGVTLDQLE